MNREDWARVAIRDATLHGSNHNIFSVVSRNYDAFQILEEMYGPIDTGAAANASRVTNNWLAEAGDPRVFDYLLERFSGPSFLFWPTLVRQARNGNREIVTRLLPLVKAHKGRPGRFEALEAVVRSGDVKSVRFLLEDEAIPVEQDKERFLISDAIAGDNLEMYLYMRERYPEATDDLNALLDVIASDSINIFSYLVRQTEGMDWIDLLQRAEDANSQRIIALLLQDPSVGLQELILRELMSKLPAKTELLDWMISLDDSDLEEAAADVINATELVPERLIPFNCLFLAMLYPTLTREEQLAQLCSAGASDQTLIKTEALLLKYKLTELRRR